MKIKHILALLLLILTTQAFSEDLRKFTSADGTKTFDGVLTRYDATSGTVEVKRTGLGPLKFPLTMLSAADQAYVKEQSVQKYKPVLFKQTKLLYSDDFSAPQLNKEFWQARGSPAPTIVEGVLSLAPPMDEVKAKELEAQNQSAVPFPVIWLVQVPENFVCTMRLRYGGGGYRNIYPLLDLGHHIHTVSFGEKVTTLRIKKDVEILAAQKPLFSLNEWHDVAIEVKKGAIHLTIDGAKHLFESENIDMTGHHQIDFKGVPFGTCEIDDVKLWEGLE